MYVTENILNQRINVFSLYRKSWPPDRLTTNHDLSINTYIEYAQTSSFLFFSPLLLLLLLPFPFRDSVTKLDIILLAHTLGTSDFFLPRVLPRGIPRSSFLLNVSPLSLRISEKKIYFFVFSFFTIYRKERNLTLLMGDDEGGWEGRRRLSIVRQIGQKTPATLVNALVVSTSQTTHGLYTLPLLKSLIERLSPKTLIHSDMVV